MNYLHYSISNAILPIFSNTLIQCNYGWPTYSIDFHNLSPNDVPNNNNVVAVFRIKLK